jgi:hypothetical protein
VNCLEFRRHAGAEPFSADVAAAAHRHACPACARYQDEMQAMDRLLGKAMRIDTQRQRVAAEGSDPAAGSDPTHGGRRAPTLHRRWFALAASLVGGVLVAATLWFSYPSPTLAAEVIGHAMHEPDAWSADQPLGAGALAEVLEPNGVRLRPGAGSVTFAKRCLFEGRIVPHLVVQTAAGPVTVFLLGHRSVEAAMRVEEDGYSAVVLPAPRGSIAVVGRNGARIEAIAHQVFSAVEWEA